LYIYTLKKKNWSQVKLFFDKILPEAKFENYIPSINYQNQTPTDFLCQIFVTKILNEKLSKNFKYHIQASESQFCLCTTTVSQNNLITVPLNQISKRKIRSRKEIPNSNKSQKLNY
jgi:hypothetical protein